VIRPLIAEGKGSAVCDIARLRSISCSATSWPARKLTGYLHWSTSWVIVWCRAVERRLNERSLSWESSPAEHAELHKYMQTAQRIFLETMKTRCFRQKYVLFIPTCTELWYQERNKKPIQKTYLWYVCKNLGLLLTYKLVQFSDTILRSRFANFGSCSACSLDERTWKTADCCCGPWYTRIANRRFSIYQQNFSSYRWSEIYCIFDLAIICITCTFMSCNSNLLFINYSKPAYAS